MVISEAFSYLGGKPGTFLLPVPKCVCCLGFGNGLLIHLPAWGTAPCRTLCTRANAGPFTWESSGPVGGRRREGRARSRLDCTDTVNDDRGSTGFCHQIACTPTLDPPPLTSCAPLKKSLTLLHIRFSHLKIMRLRVPTSEG